MAEANRSVVLLVGLALGSAAGSGGCNPNRATVSDDGGATGAPSASTGSSAPSAHGATSASPAERSARPPRVPCRAVTVEGVVHLALVNVDAGGGGTALGIKTGDELPQDLWIGLDRKARLTAEDPRTTRETLFVGPATVRPCVGHREESWVASGAFESEHGAGETPGSEEWVATPNAVVRYAAAKLRIEVSAGDTQTTLGNGVALVWPASDARIEVGRTEGAGTAGHPDPDGGVTEGWRRLGEGGIRVLSPAAPPADAARAALDACASIAARSEALTRALLGQPAGDGGARSMAAVIVEQVSTRRLARAACAVAAVRVNALPPSPGRTDLAQRLHEADDAWTALPVASSAARTP